MYVHNKKNNWQYTDEKYYSQDKRAEWNKKYKFDDFNSFDANAKYGTKDLIRSWIVWKKAESVALMQKHMQTLLK